MASLTFIFCALFLLQGTWGSPAKSTNSDQTSGDVTDKINEVTTTVTLGTQLSNNMNDNLLKVMDNLRVGAVQISTPVVKFGLDTVPNLFTSGFKTLAESAVKMAEANKKGFRKVFNGAASAVGGAAVLGSSIVGGNMQIAGSTFGAVNGLIEASAKFGLDLTGNLADTTALSNMLFANITKDILTGIGGGLNFAGDGIKVISTGSAKVIEAIGNSVSNSISNGQEAMAKWFRSGSAKLQDGAITLTTAAQVEYYNALQWYLHNLLAMEGIMDKLTEAINPSEKKKDSTDKTNDGDKNKADAAAETGADDETKAGAAEKSDADDKTGAAKKPAAADDDDTKAGAAKKPAAADDNDTKAGAAEKPAAADNDDETKADATKKPADGDNTSSPLADAAQKTAAVAASAPSSA